MELKLKKPICFFDLETTGVNVSKDRIVEISILKVFPNGNKESFTWRVNPEMKIPPVTTAIHGISDEMVLNEPTFKELAPKVYELIKDSDLGGFNSNRFDIPLLAEELFRAEIDFDLKNKQAVDVQTIFHKMEKRTLEAAYKFYCNKELTNAHSAEADTQATYEVLKAQLDKYDDLENDMDYLSKFSAHQKFADFAGFIGYNKQGQEIITFGKHKGKVIEELFKTEPGYFSWIQNADFPNYTKKVMRDLKNRINNKFEGPITDKSLDMLKNKFNTK
jgi:DNA polymerase-3 subunit epsilon